MTVEPDPGLHGRPASADNDAALSWLEAAEPLVEARPSAATPASPPSFRAALPEPVRDLPSWLLLDMGYAPAAAAVAVVEAEGDQLSWLDEVASGFGAPLEEAPAGPWEGAPIAPTRPEIAPAPEESAEPHTPIKSEPPTPVAPPAPPKITAATEVNAPLPPMPTVRRPDVADFPTEPDLPELAGLDDALAGLDRRPRERLGITPEDGTNIDVLAILDAEMREAEGPQTPQEETNIDLLSVLEAELTEQLGRDAVATDTDVATDEQQLASIMAVLGGEAADEIEAEQAPPPDTAPPPDAAAVEGTLISAAEPTIISARQYVPPEPATPPATPPTAAPEVQTSTETPADKPAAQPTVEQGSTSPTIVHVEETSSVFVANLANEIPDDPDEAIAWLEKMAQESSRRGARRQDKRAQTVSSSPPAEVTPPVAEPPTPVNAPTLDSAPTPPAVAIAPTPPAVAPAAVLPDLEGVLPETLDDALAWLDELVASEKRREELEDATDIVEPLPPTPVASAPSAEEIIPPITLPEEVDDALDWLDQFAAEQGPTGAELAVDSEVDTQINATTAPAASQEEPLHAQAQTALAAGDIELAVTAFEKLLEQPDSAAGLLPALQAASAEHPQALGLQRVLGDAYAQQGQAAEAAQTYRQALIEALSRLANSSKPTPSANL